MPLNITTTKVFDRIVANHAARVQILQGGSSSSKTYSALQYLITLAINVKGPRLISVVSETLPHLRKGAERDFFKIIGDSYQENRHNKTERIYRIGLNQIEFFSADQPSKVRGPRRDILFVNEANNIPKETFDQLEIRTKSKILIDYNPVAEFWANELIGKPGVTFDVSTYLDNTFLDQNIVKSIESRRYNPDGTESDWWKTYGLGLLGTSQGCVLIGWDQIDSIPDGVMEKTTYGLDFGFTNDPTALTRVCLSGTSVYVEQLIYERGLTNQDISARMDSLGLDRRTTAIYADSAEPKSIEDLRRLGWAVKPTVKGKDSIHRGLDFIKSRTLHVTKDSVDLIKELRNYKWMTDTNGKPTNIPVDDWNHAIDSIRYALTYKIVNHEINTRKMRF